MRSDEEFFRVQGMLMRHPDFRAWYARLGKVGGCENPVYLTGRTPPCDRSDRQGSHTRPPCPAAHTTPGNPDAASASPEPGRTLHRYASAVPPSRRYL